MLGGKFEVLGQWSEVVSADRVFDHVALLHKFHIALSASVRSHFQVHSKVILEVVAAVK